jgi:hypothetical protein
MLWPDGSNFTVQDIIHNLQYLKACFLVEQNMTMIILLYIVAGEVIHVVSGKSCVL